MSTSHADLFAALAAPFERGEVKTRPQGGRQLSYITARTAMNRLDNVLGPENWWDSYEPHENSVLCRLTIRLPDGTTLTKCDAGGYAGMSDSGDDDKSGYSDSFKRACVKFGVARYLYRDGVPHLSGEHAAEDHAPAHDPRREVNDSFRPSADSRPEGAWSGQRPDRTRDEAPRQSGHAPQNGGGSYGDRPPATGKALFAWIRKQDEAHPDLNLLKSVNNWAKQNELGGKMVEWPNEEIPGAYAAALHFLDQAGA